MELIKSNGDFATNFIACICNDEIFFNDRLIKNQQQMLNGRLADALLYFKNETYDQNPFLLDVTKNEVALYQGASRESVSHALKDFQDHKFKKTEKNQVHMNAVRRLIEGFGMKAGDIFSKGPGLYSNNELQNMYTELINKGKGSLSDALKAGVLIEKTDIEDLERQVAEATNQSITTVYTHLLAASKIHLRAFQSKL